MTKSPPSVVTPSPVVVAVLITRLPPDRLVSMVVGVIKEYPLLDPALESVVLISISSGSIK